MKAGNLPPGARFPFLHGPPATRGAKHRNSEVSRLAQRVHSARRTRPSERSLTMEQRRENKSLRTEEMAAQPARSTQDVRDAAERADRSRWERPGADGKTALFPEPDLNQMRSQWNGIQSQFVDQPRHSVEQADGLVAQTIQRLAASFAEARANLEVQWSRGGDVSTEDL